MDNLLHLYIIMAASAISAADEGRRDGKKKKAIYIKFEDGSTKTMRIAEYLLREIPFFNMMCNGYFQCQAEKTVILNTSPYILELYLTFKSLQVKNCDRDSFTHHVLQTNPILNKLFIQTNPIKFHDFLALQNLIEFFCDDDVLLYINKHYWYCYSCQNCFGNASNDDILDIVYGETIASHYATKKITDMFNNTLNSNLRISDLRFLQSNPRDQNVLGLFLFCWIRSIDWEITMKKYKMLNNDTYQIIYRFISRGRLPRHQICILNRPINDNSWDLYIYYRQGKLDEPLTSYQSYLDLKCLMKLLHNEAFEWPIKFSVQEIILYLTDITGNQSLDLATKIVDNYLVIRELTYLERKYLTSVCPGDHKNVIKFFLFCKQLKKKRLQEWLTAYDKIEEKNIYTIIGVYYAWLSAQ